MAISGGGGGGGVCTAAIKSLSVTFFALLASSFFVSVDSFAFFIIFSSFSSSLLRLLCFAFSPLAAAAEVWRQDPAAASVARIPRVEQIVGTLGEEKRERERPLNGSQTHTGRQAELGKPDPIHICSDFFFLCAGFSLSFLRNGNKTSRFRSFFFFFCQHTHTAGTHGSSRRTLSVDKEEGDTTN